MMKRSLCLFLSAVSVWAVQSQPQSSTSTTATFKSASNYNTKSAQKYIQRIRELKLEGSGDGSINSWSGSGSGSASRRRLANNKNDGGGVGGGNAKPNNQKPNGGGGGGNKKETPAPTSIPTPSPTRYPTRAPVVVSWKSEIDGYVEIGMSVFTHEDNNDELLEAFQNDGEITDADNVVGTGYVGTVGNGFDRRQRRGRRQRQRHLQPVSKELEKQNLSKLNAGDILAGKEPKLIEEVLSVLATVLCEDTDYLILNTANDEFFDFCKQNVNSTDAVMIPEGLDNVNSTVLVTDLTDTGTGLLQVEDRSVFVNNWSLEDGMGTEKGGEYLHWTLWTVKYPILNIEYDNVVVGDIYESGDTEVKDLFIEKAVGKMQQNVDRTFATAISDGTVDTLLSKDSDNILAVSSIGWEVETFSKAVDSYLEQFQTDDDDGKGDGTLSSILDGSVEGLEYKVWQPIRIIGIIMLLAVCIFVYFLMKIGNSKQKYDVWDATQNKSQTDVDLVTYEGVNFMLETGRKASASGDLNKSRSGSTKGNSPRSGDEEGALDMDMGNTASELVGLGSPPTPRRSLSNFVRRKLSTSKGDGSQLEDDGGDDHTQVLVNPKSYGLCGNINDGNEERNQNEWIPISPIEISQPLPPPGLESPTTSALLKTAVDQNGTTADGEGTPPKKPKSKKFKFKRGEKKKDSMYEVSPPSTPSGAEKVQHQDAYAFIQVTSKG